MLQMTAAADKAKKKEEPLDTSRMKTIPADTKATEIPAATSVVS